MRIVVKYILSFVLASLFLVSFTGLRLLIHHCMACETTDYYLFAQVEDCCDTHHQNHAAACSLPDDAHSNCCAENSENNQDSCQNCCQDEVVYLIKEYEVSHDRQQIRIEPLVVDALLPVWTEKTTITEEPSHLAAPNFPPPMLVGKSFVLFTHQIKTGPALFQA